MTSLILLTSDSAVANSQVCEPTSIQSLQLLPKKKRRAMLVVDMIIFAKTNAKEWVA